MDMMVFVAMTVSSLQQFQPNTFLGVSCTREDLQKKGWQPVASSYKFPSW